MSYKVTIKREAVKELRLLPKHTCIAISEAIDGLSVNPRPAGCIKLSGKPLWRIRIGNYRVIYRIEDVIQIVDVLTIGHRKDVYE